MKRYIWSALALAAVFLATTAIPAGAVFVSGQQKVVNEKTGAAKMSGGLIGDWTFTSFKPLALKPTFKAKGTEKFVGCVDVNSDGSCTGDPSGTLKFSFRFWAHFAGGDPSKAEQLGTCAHRVTGASGGLAGATGFLMMVDTPKGNSLKTHYEGEINLSTARLGRSGGGSPPRGC